MADLRNCPFCGGEAELIENNRYTDIHSVMCKNCYSESDRYNTKEKAIKAWNTRKPMEAVVAKLEKEYDLADKEKARCMRENLLQYYEAKGYERGIDIAISIVRGKE